ncbi:MAG: GNAT family protein, partial [Eubacteriales bacterium]
KCRARIKDLLKRNMKKGCPNHFVLLLGDEIIGLAGFPVMEQGIKDGSAWGFYYQIIKKYWGQGLGTEAAKALLAYLFQRYPHAVVYADSVADNLASATILKKLGFELKHTDEKCFTKNGLEQDILHFKTQGEKQLKEQ